ncbi:alanyl-tRNA editing protein [Bosea sp. (in: a-proteobacteria)]|jgi:misacylated tRNA(Ala) deacylase|uniref:alanyl-tRNA editing protein n=1 Tax=Bosea sp. (in: a-proteobacteria) TaxID=1871050 RepID=UPI003F709208
MSRYFCLDHPDVLTLATEVVEARPGRVVLAESPFYPGGGGQLPDRGTLAWAGGEVAVSGFESEGGRLWHLLAEPLELPPAPVEARVDGAFRRLMRALHTDLHIVNAVVFQDFDGALVTGVQMNEDGTARIDFDLPDADNERLRAIEGTVNDLIRQDLAVCQSHVPEAAVFAEPGLVRSRSVTPPPTSDGQVRIVEIVGLDRQACGGTHLASTGASPPIRILKIDNKGRHNRRLRIGLAGGM